MTMNYAGTKTRRGRVASRAGELLVEEQAPLADDGDVEDHEALAERRDAAALRGPRDSLDDDVRTYLREIGRAELVRLTPDEILAGAT